MARSRRNTILAVASGTTALVALILLWTQGCGGRPRAPALYDEPIYYNAQEGIRFHVPEGWKNQARGEFPPQQMVKERLLVEYRSFAENRLASLMVSMVDLPAEQAIPEYVESRLFKKGDWRKLPGEQLQIGSLPAERLVFASHDKLIREVLAVRRRQRVYFFTSVRAEQDTASHQQIRHALDTLTFE